MTDRIPPNSPQGIDAAKVDLVMVAGTRAAQLRRMADKADAITWKTSAVLREQASLLLTMAAKIKELEAERDAASCR